MNLFPMHTEATAPEGARETLGGIRRALGFVPNLMSVMAEAPPTLEAYLTLSKLFESTSLSPIERNIVLLTVSFENGCTYCMAAHSKLAAMQGVPADVLTALREGIPIQDPKLQALRAFTAAVTTRRGDIPEETLQNLFSAGYRQQQVLEILLGVTQKTLSNYVNHLAGTPLDEAFASMKWSKPTQQ